MALNAPSRTLLLLAAFCLLLSCSEPPRFEPLPPGTTVLAFGDSVTHGTGAGPGEDYPSRLAEATGWQVVNAGVPGDTAQAARERIRPLLERHRPELVIVELGGNDFLRQQRPRQVKRHLREILEAALDSGAVVVLVAVPRLSMLRASLGALEDSDIYAELAGQMPVVLVEDVFSQVLSEEALRADRIHPNARGYAVLAAGILGQLREAGLAPPG